MTVAGQSDPCGDNFDSDIGDFTAGAPLSPFFNPCVGTVGSSRRNLLRGPGLSQWDMSLIKNTKITERLSVEFRWEVYNILNRANFSLSSIDNTGGSSTFGRMNQTPDVSAGNPVIAQGGPRNMNYTIKFIF